MCQFNITCDNLTHCKQTDEWMHGMKRSALTDLFLWKKDAMKGKRGRLTQEVLWAVCVVVIILREVIDSVAASFVDSCESDRDAIRRSSRDSAVMYEAPNRHPLHPYTTAHTFSIMVCFNKDSNKSISIPLHLGDGVG